MLEKIPAVRLLLEMRWALENEKLRTAKVIDWLPHMFGRNESVPDGLVGATIVQIGTFKDTSLVEGGGLVIDYLPPQATQTRRAILAFDGTEMWLDSDASLET